MMRPLALAIASCLIVACATTRPTVSAPDDAPWQPLVEGAVPADNADNRTAQARIAAAAESSLGARSMVVGGVRHRFDCSGVVRAIYAKAGYELGTAANDLAPSDTASLFAWLRANGSLRRHHPQVGDLVFFDNTYDRNDDGRDNDWLSHVGIVETVDDDGTVGYIHRIGASVVRFHMNLSHPSVGAGPAGKVWNHGLRAARHGHPARLGAELFVAFGTPPYTPMSRLVAEHDVFFSKVAVGQPERSDG
jgi:peptidoglycan DL-endopeptidase CwlO